MGREPRREGGRWDPSLEGVILASAMAAVAELGYDRMTMDDLAKRAGVGKAAIYRRWSSKSEVVAAAIAHWRRSLGVPEVVDTGSLRGDLDQLMHAVRDYDEAELTTFRVVIGVATAAMNDSALYRALDEQVLTVPRQIVQTVLDRAVARGEIPPDRQLSVLPDAILGLNLMRIISGKPLDKAFIRRVLDELVLAQAR